MRTDSVVIRYIALRAAPFIQLYALYVLGHGEDGPGGGFQGGVIFAASFVLMALAWGWSFGRKHAPEGVTDVLAPTGALLYAGIGFVCLILGGTFLEYAALAMGDESAEHAAHHFGLIGIEAGVMITVTASMIILFFDMSRRDDDGDGIPDDEQEGPEALSDAAEPKAPPGVEGEEA